LEDDEDINMASEELAELLADGPITKKQKLVVCAAKTAANDNDSDEDMEGDYGLKAWV
jgi:hypothetical protein